MYEPVQSEFFCGGLEISSWVCEASQKAADLQQQGLLIPTYMYIHTNILKSVSRSHNYYDCYYHYHYHCHHYYYHYY
jgi:hypothetical protein